MASASDIMTPMFKISSSTATNRSGLCSPKFVSESIRCSSTTLDSPMTRLVSKGCKLVGCGSAVPNTQFSNDDLAKIIDTSHEWISSRTGIHNRRIL
ncbi:hypothetical protein M8C21_014720, partial [Ambrosia artemisiifolia]